MTLVLCFFFFDKRTRLLISSKIFSFTASCLIFKSHRLPPFRHYRLSGTRKAAFGHFAYLLIPELHSFLRPRPFSFLSTEPRLLTTANVVPTNIVTKRREINEVDDPTPSPRLLANLLNFRYRLAFSSPLPFFDFQIIHLCIKMHPKNSSTVQTRKAPQSGGLGANSSNGIAFTISANFCLRSADGALMLDHDVD